MCSNATACPEPTACTKERVMAMQSMFLGSHGGRDAPVFLEALKINHIFTYK